MSVRNLRATDSVTHPRCRAVLNGTYSISLDNLEDWNILDQSAAKQEKQTNLKINKCKMAYFTKSLLHPTKQKDQTVAHKKESDNTENNVFQVTRNLSRSQKEKQNCKSTGSSSQKKKEKTTVSRYHSLNPLIFSSASISYGVFSKSSSNSSRSFLSSKRSKNRMSTSMSNIASPDKKNKKSPSPTRTGHPPSAPTSPSRSLRVFTKEQYSSANNSPNSSLYSSITCFETVTPATSTPVSDSCNVPPIDTPSVSPISDSQGDKCKLNFVGNLYSEMKLSTLISPGTTDPLEKVNKKPSFVLPTLQIDKPHPSHGTSFGSVRGCPRKFPGVMGNRGYTHGTEKGNLQDQTNFPCGHPGARWKLWKQKTCPDLLKTRSSENLFR